MSLYNFYKDQFKQNNDLRLFCLSPKEKPFSKQINFNYLLLYYSAKREKYYPIEIYFNIMFHEYFCKASITVDDYNKLKQKSKRISQLSQKLFKISIMVDLLDENTIRNSHNIIYDHKDINVSLKQ